MRFSTTVGRIRLFRSRAKPRRPSRRFLIGLIGTLLACSFLAGGLSRLEVETGVKSFVPSSDPAVDLVDQLARSFGGDPVVALLESERRYGLLAGDQVGRALRLEGELADTGNVASVYGPATVLNQVAGQVQKLMAELSGRRQGMRSHGVAEARQRGASDKEARKAGDKAVAAFDARYGALLAQGLPAGLPTLRNESFVKAVVRAQDGEPRAQWRFVVPSARSVAIIIRPREGLDQSSTEQLVTDVRAAISRANLDTGNVTVSGGPAVVSGLGEQVRAEMPLIGGAAIGAVALCFLIVPWTQHRRRLLPVMTTLAASGLTLAALGWLGHPLSLGVVAFLPVLLGIGSYYPTYFAQHANRRVVFAVAAATALSFGALGLSPLPFVADLGLTLGLGIVAACAVGLLLTKPRPNAPRDMEAVSTSNAGAVHEHRPDRRRLRTRRRMVGAAAGLVAIAGWLLLPVLPLKADLESLANGLPALQEAERVQHVLGSSGEVSILLHGKDVTSPDAISWMQETEDMVITSHGDQMRPIVSPPRLLEFLGSQPSKQQASAGLRLLPPYLLSSVIRDDQRVAKLTFGVSINDAKSLQKLRDDLRRNMQPPAQGYRAELVGLPMVAVRAYEQVSADRYLANAAGPAAAGLVLAFGLRRRRDAGRAVLAAGLATGAGFIILWLTGTALNPVTVALGSLTAAIGCEFTVMLTEAARRADRALRRSVGLATACSVAGYGALVVSQLQGIREFGALLAVSVVLSFLAAKFVTWLFPVSRESSDEDLRDQTKKNGTSASRLVGAD